MKKIFLIFIWFSFMGTVQFCLGQNRHRIDSLEWAQSQQKDDTNKVETLILISKEAFRYNSDTLKYYSQLIKNLSDKLKYNRGLAKSLQGFGIAARQTGNYPLAFNYQRQWITLAEKMNDNSEMFAATHSIANTYSESGDYKTEIVYRLKAKQLAEHSPDKSILARANSGLATAYVETGDSKNAMSCALVALKLQEELKNTNEILQCYNVIAAIHNSQKDYDKALKCYQKTIDMGKESGDLCIIQMGNFAIAQINRNLKNYDESIVYYNKSLELSKQLKDKKWIGGNYNGLGQVYREQGNLDEALKYQQMCVEIGEQIKDVSLLSNGYQQLGLLFSAKGNNNDAILYTQKSIVINKQTGNKTGLQADYKSLSNCYYNAGDYKNSVDYLLQFTYLNDTILNEETKTITAELEAKYENDKKEKEIELLIKDKDIQNFTMKEQRSFLLEQRMQAEKKENEIKILNQDKNIQALKFEKNETDLEHQKFQTVAKQKEVSLLNKNKEIQNIEIKKQKLLKYFFIGGLALVIFLLLFGYRFYRARQVLRLQAIRNKISGDLHDDIGSTLNSISVYSEVARKKDAQQIEALEMIGDASRKVIDSMSDIVWSINPENDSFAKIIFRMKSLTYNLLRAKRIEFTFPVDEAVNEKKLSIEERRNFYLIFKESLNNLVKYSNATQAMIALTYKNGFIKLCIKDDGVGFNCSQYNEGNGLKNMKRRADEMKAQFKIESEKGYGTQIELILKA